MALSKMDVTSEAEPVKVSVDIGSSQPVENAAAGGTIAVSSIIDSILKLLSSVRSGLVMLGILLTCCLLGMLIMQVNVEGFQRYYNNLSPASRAVFGRLGFFDIYHSWYFSLLLAVTGLNIILASIDRFPTAWQYISKPKLSASPKFIRAQMFSYVSAIEGTPHLLKERIAVAWRNETRTYYKKVVAVLTGLPIVLLAIGLKLEGASGSTFVGILVCGVVLLILGELLLVPFLSRRAVKVNLENERI